MLVAATTWDTIWLMVWLWVDWLGSVYTASMSGSACGAPERAAAMASPSPAGTTMTAARSPARILSRLDSWVPSASSTSPVASKPERTAVEASDPSRSTQPMVN